MERKKDYGCIALLIFLITLPYCFIGLGKNFILGCADLDMAHSFIPPIGFIFNMLSRGVIALWNPYIFCGTPFLLEPQFALLYPFNLLYLILPLASATNFLIILHQIMAGVFMYLYLKLLTRDRFSSFIGALVFALSSVFPLHIFAGHVSVFYAISWMPLFFLLVHKLALEKKNIWIVSTAIILMLQIFAGHIQFVFITCCGLLAYVSYLSFINKRIFPLKAFLIATGLGLGLAAVQIIPLMSLMRDSLRGDNILFKQFFSLPYENIITLVCPGFFGWVKNNTWWGKWYPWETTFYIGILPLLFAIFAVFRKANFAKFFLVLFLFALVFSFAAYLPYSEKIYKYLFGFNFFRTHARFLALAVFSLSVLAALGVKSLKNAATKEGKRAVVFTIIFAGLLILGLGFIETIIVVFPLLWAKFFNFLISYDKLASVGNLTNNAFAFLIGRDTTLFNLNSSIAFLILAIVLLALYLRSLLGENLKKVLIVGVIIVDLWGFGAWQLTAFNIERCYLDRNIAEFFKINLKNDRFVAVRSKQPNAGMLNEFSFLGGYGPFVEKRYNEFLNLVWGVPIDKPFAVVSGFKPSPLIGILSPKYLIIPKEIDFNRQGLRHVFTTKEFDVCENNFFLPRVFIAHKAEFISARDNIFKALSEKKEDYLRSTIIIEESVNPALNIIVGPPDPEPEIIQYSPNKVIIKACLNSPGYLVLADTYSRGWQVYVDGRRGRILPADYVLRAVFLTAGEHIVKFVYSPVSLKIGSLISLAFLIIICGLLAVILSDRAKARERRI